MTVEKPEVISIATAEIEKEKFIEVINVESDDDDRNVDVLIKEEEEEFEEGFNLAEFEKISQAPQEFTHSDFSSNDLLVGPIAENIGKTSGQSSKRSSSDNQSSQGAGIFNKDEIMIELQRKQNRTVLRYMFLEEAAWKIFSKSVKELDPVKVWGLSAINKRDYTEFFHLIRVKQQPVNEVQTKHRIVTIKEIYCQKLSKYYYPVFHVRRSDGTDWVFSEADFPLLRHEDFEHIYDFLRNLQIKPFDLQVALKSVKRTMKAMMKLTSIEDFQIGIEALQPKINLTIPNQQLEDIQELPFGLLIEEPEFGIVFRNMKSKKIFIRFEEVAKYSDGTLKAIVRLLKKKLEQEKIIKPAKSDRDLIIKALDIVEERLEGRNTIRRFEMCYGERPKKFFAFQPPRK